MCIAVVIAGEPDRRVGTLHFEDLRLPMRGKPSAFALAVMTRESPPAKTVEVLTFKQFVEDKWRPNVRTTGDDRTRERRHRAVQWPPWSANAAPAN